MRPGDTEMGAGSPSVLRSLADAWAGLWRHAEGRRGMLGAAAVLLLVAELLRLPLPWLAGEAVNLLQRQGRAGAGAAALWLAALLATALLAWSIHAAGRVAERNVALHARSSLMLDLMRRLLRTPLAWHRREHPLAVAQRATQGSTALTEFAESQYIYVQTLVQIAGPVIALTLISPWVGAAAAVGLALLGAASLGFDRVLLRLADARNDAERRNGATWGELLANVPTLLALRLESGVLALVRQRLAAVLRPLRRQVLVNEMKWGAIDVLGHVLWCALVAVYVIQADSSGAIALGSLFMVYEYARRAASSLADLAGDFSKLANQLSGWRTLQPLLAAPAAGQAVELSATPWRHIDLHNVSLAFDACKHRVLHGLDLRLRRGGRYALTGPSGAGKSALLALLAGLEPACTGSIEIDGASADADRLRREATLVPAHAAVFEGSVRENLAPGTPVADNVLWSALETVELGSFVAAQPMGLDSAVGDGLARWSSGQLQRLALARASLSARGSSLLLLDEPTSHLDRQAAHSVLQRLLAAHPGACIVAALHDPSLACTFDGQITLAEGAIVRPAVAA